jgi:hypothetical protein
MDKVQKPINSQSQKIELYTYPCIRSMKTLRKMKIRESNRISITLYEKVAEIRNVKVVCYNENKVVK